MAGTEPPLVRLGGAFGFGLENLLAAGLIFPRPFFAAPTFSWFDSGVGKALASFSTSMSTSESAKPESEATAFGFGMVGRGAM